MTISTHNDEASENDLQGESKTRGIGLSPDQSVSVINEVNMHETHLTWALGLGIPITQKIKPISSHSHEWQSP